MACTTAARLASRQSTWRHAINSGSATCGIFSISHCAVSRRPITSMLEFPKSPGSHVVNIPSNARIENIAAMAIQSVTANSIDDDGLGCAIAMVDIGKLRSQFDFWVKSLPNVKPYYAVKCNPDAGIIRALADMGANFDCASKGEMESVLAVGVAPHRILYANPCKFRSHLRFAREVGVNRMTFDNETELHKIKETFGPKAELFLRLRVEDTGSWCPMGMKFGAAGHEHLDALLQTAETLGLQIKGVSFHVGSGGSAEGNFTKALADAKGVFDLARQKYPNSHGRTMSILDIGGGFPGDVCKNSFNSVVSEINASLAEMAYLDLEVIAEPGRFFATQCTTLVTEIVGTRHLKSANAAESKVCGGSDDGAPRAHYSISDGVYGSFGDLVYYPACTTLPQPIPMTREDLRSLEQGARHSESLRLKDSVDSSADETFPVLLFGPTCDGLDTIGTFTLPRMQERDYLLWTNMGAYTQAQATSFNGIPLPTPWYFEREASTSGDRGAALDFAPHMVETTTPERRSWGSWAALGLLVGALWEDLGRVRSA